MQEDDDAVIYFILCQLHYYLIIYQRIYISLWLPSIRLPFIYIRFSGPAEHGDVRRFLHHRWLSSRRFHILFTIRIWPQFLSGQMVCFLIFSPIRRAGHNTDYSDSWVIADSTHATFSFSIARSPAAFYHAVTHPAALSPVPAAPPPHYTPVALSCHFREQGRNTHATHAPE